MRRGGGGEKSQEKRVQKNLVRRTDTVPDSTVNHRRLKIKPVSMEHRGRRGGGNQKTQRGRSTRASQTR